MVAIESGKFMLVSDEQPKKTPLLIIVIVLGNVALVSDLQY